MERHTALEWSKANVDWKGLRRGWCRGAKGFRKGLLEMIGQKQGRQHYREELKESDQQKAGRWVAQILKQKVCVEEDLLRRRRGDPVKVKMAAELRVQAMKTWPWIAEWSATGRWRTAANSVRAIQ